MTAIETLANETLQADLVVRKGGNKARLIARCWVATDHGAECGLNADQYQEFRKAWMKETFDKIHQTFDQFLPAEFRAKPVGHQYGNAGRGRQAKQANGLSPAQQKQLECFLKAPARLEKRFQRSADYYASLGCSAHLRFLIKQHTDAAEACREMTQETLLGLWNLGMRGSGELEMMIEKTYGI